MSNHAALVAAQAAVVDALAIGDPIGVIDALRTRACLAYEDGDYLLARALHSDVLLRCRELELLAGMGAALCDLAMIDLAEGDVDAARVRFERGLACYEDGGLHDLAAAARSAWAAKAAVA